LDQRELLEILFVDLMEARRRKTDRCAILDGADGGTARTEVHDRHLPEAIALFEHSEEVLAPTPGFQHRDLASFEDEGPGIPPELLSQVFEPFFRVDPGRRQNIPGAGLGLTIAREIVQRSGGDIKISNRTGGGLKQVVELAKVEDDDLAKLEMSASETRPLRRVV
jgi:hypothetical protein